MFALHGGDRMGSSRNWKIMWESRSTLRNTAGSVCMHHIQFARENKGDAGEAVGRHS